MGEGWREGEREREGERGGGEGESVHKSMKIYNFVSNLHGL